MNAKSTKKVKTAEADTMRAEYSREALGKGVRGKYFKQVTESSNVVVIEPDLVARFPNAKAVNAALRAVVKIAEQVKAA